MTVEPAPEVVRLIDERPPDPAGVHESFKVRFLRWLGWYRHFGYWLATVWSGLSAAVESRGRTLLIGAQPAEPDPTLRPDYYQALLALPRQPDRPALTKFEKSSPGEATAVERVAKIAAAAVIKAYCDAKKDNRAAKAMRDQHAKHHGCVQARFVVRPDLPPEFAVGVFQPGAIYPAVVRFSNAMGAPQADRKRDGRGFAVKLRNVEGPNLLTEMVPQHTGGEQDFLMTSHPVFFCRGVADYTAFMAMLSEPQNTHLARLRGIAKFGLFFLLRPLRLLRAFWATAKRKVANPLSADYHSMTPYLFGESRVVRYMVTPISGDQSSRKGGDKQNDNFLRDALREALNPTKHGSGKIMAFDFAVQFRDAAAPRDVEDASLPWRRRRDRRVPLGRIEIPTQWFDIANEECACESLSFNPWNCHPLHRPLGGLNRMRLAVYRASMQVRHRLNGL